jgi:NAD-dependent DNA ligase
MSLLSESELVVLLKKASDAYYNNLPDGILGDDDYDRLREELEDRFPKNPYLKQIGAPVEKGAVRLPHKMASLTKIKPDTGSVASFADASKVKQWLLSDKLDGISVLWDTKKRKLYLRGDGLMGVDISAFAPYIPTLTPRGFKESWVLRGELVLPNDVPIDGTLSRSWVNGQLHQKNPIPEHLGKIRFVAYEMLEPVRVLRSLQFQRMTEAGFEVPVHCLLGVLNDSALSGYLRMRRDSSKYPIDGVVVAENTIPLKDLSEDVINPKDMKAFKMPLEDQKATTKVVDIVWSASHQGYWIPRIQIEPVVIGGSRIEFLTGHNARVIVQQQIGKGAVIVIRKSGDVIPTLERVVSQGEMPTLPEGEWDGDLQTASHYKVKEGATTPEIQSKKLEHFAKTLDIPHLGPGLVAKLIAEGKDTPNDLITISQGDLEIIVGKGMGSKIYPALQTCVEKATEFDLMIASSMMPRGVGSSKLKALFALQADPRLWPSLHECEGWSKGALEEFHQMFPRYELWRRNELPSIPYPKLGKTPLVVKPTGQGEQICLTGFRDADLQKQLEAKGHTIVSGVTSKTTVLLLKSLDDTSEKRKKADALGIRILSRDQAKGEFLS